MSKENNQIGERLKGLRDVLNIPVEEIADVCGISAEQYLKIENGEVDPSIYRMSKISKRYGIDLNVLLFGEEPHMGSYFLTRNGKGETAKRNNDYSYQSLASGFRGRKIEPFMTTVNPLPGEENHHKNSHDGQEFDYVIEGTLEITIGNKVMTLNPGDCIYFDAKEQHCMRALNEQPVKFLCVLSE
jgi:mannose-6-phosphate isomerase-like protein (cupin superfamily)/DNA-binding XRE family transcriptional regulator